MTKRTHIKMKPLFKLGDIVRQRNIWNREKILQEGKVTRIEKLVTMGNFTSIPHFYYGIEGEGLTEEGLLEKVK